VRRWPIFITTLNMDFFLSPDESTATPNAGDSEKVEDVPENKGSSPVDLSAEFAELNDDAPAMQEDDLRRMTTQGEGQDEKIDPSVMYSGISMADDRINQLKTESSALREWREQNSQRIEHADSKELKDDADWKEKAKLQKDEFYKQYEAENAKRKSENRAAEKTSAIDAPASREAAWAQLGSYVDFKQARQTNETDKSRMKSLLFKLKQEPPKIVT